MNCNKVRWTQLDCRGLSTDSWSLIPIAFTLSLLAFLAGCGKDDGMNRKAISGIVTVDGAPLPNGSIEFQPLFQGGLGSGAVISAGAFSIAQKDGLPPGKYRVSMIGDDGTNFGVSKGKMPGDEIMPPRKQLIPANWNANGKEDIEVKDEGISEFNFTIKSKK